jgi:hypothetical protein
MRKYSALASIIGLSSLSFNVVAIEKKQDVNELLSNPQIEKKSRFL